MSYILDALRKADSERERGEVPGLHAQPHATVVEQIPPHGVNRKLVWAVGLLAGLLALTLLAMFWGRSEPAAQAPVAGPAAIQPPVALAPPTPIPTPAPVSNEATPPQPTMTPPPGVFPPTAQPVEVPPPPPAPVAVAKQPPVATPAQAPTATSARSLMSATPTTEAKASTKSGDESRVMTVQELPESVRRELPTITIGGAMYSDTPSQRVLIINSQVLHEGDKISPELSLEQIKLKSAVFRFRNYRYVVNY